MVQLKRLGQADLTLPNPSQEKAQASTSRSQNSPFSAKWGDDPSDPKPINSLELKGFGGNSSSDQKWHGPCKRGQA